MRRLNEIGDDPIEPVLDTQMKALGRVIDETFNGKDTPLAKRTMGFVLMVFPFDTEKFRCNYISNGQREDIVAMLKEQAKRFEERPDIKGAA